MGVLNGELNFDLPDGHSRIHGSRYYGGRTGSKLPEPTFRKTSTDSD